MTTKAGERLLRNWDDMEGGIGVETAIAAVEADAVRDALTDLRAAVVEMFPMAGIGDTVPRAAVLNEIGKRMPRGAA